MIALNNGTMFDYEHDGAANTLSYCRSDFRNTGKPSKVKIAYLNGHVRATRSAAAVRVDAVCRRLIAVVLRQIVIESVSDCLCSG